MSTKFGMCLLCALLCSVTVRADDDWYRFPTSLEGKWKIANAETAGHVKAAYVGQAVDIAGSTIVLRSNLASNEYALTFVNASNPLIELDLTATSPDGSKKITFRCIMDVSQDQIRLCRPQNDRSPRPRDIESPEDSETIFSMVRDTSGPKP
ncbi:MAG: hypothetical protein IT422_29210 [Pirellulaceae bacterium]|jgi:uncharacterized protein (TIGR03067 family)|nr:hypothetical protein [Pirellulaceae bacterium]